MASTYPVDPARALLLARADEHNLSLSDLAHILRLPRRTLHRVLSRPRLRWDTADRVAIALGHHPVELWPTWYDDIKETSA